MDEETIKKEANEKEVINKETINKENNQKTHHNSVTKHNTQNKKSNWKINFTLVLLSLFFSLLFLELILAQFYPQSILKYQHVIKPTEYHPVLGWFNKKKFSEESVICNKVYKVKTNNLGFRDDEEYTSEKDPTKKRIVILGDSFMFGEGLDNKEIYTTQLRNILGNKYEIWNLGVPAYGTDQEALLLHELFNEAGKNNWPDVVIVGFFQNDLANIHSLYAGNETERGFKPRVVIRNGTLGIVNCCPVPKIETTPVIFHSFFERFHTYIFFRDKYNIILSKIHPRQKKNYLQEYHESENTMLVGYNFQEDMDLLVGITDELRKMAKEHNFKLVFLNIPHNFQVDKKAFQDYLSQFSDVNESFFKADRLNRIMNALANSRKDITYIDLLPIFEKEGNIPGEKSNIFYPCTRDMHWNALRAKRAAEETTKVLKEKRIV